MLGQDLPDMILAGVDLLVSNPPYVPEKEFPALPEEVRDWEPCAALIAPGDPLVFYRGLAQHGLRMIREGGWIVLETHADYGEPVCRMLEEAGYAEVCLEKDMAGRDRVVLGRRGG